MNDKTIQGKLWKDQIWGKQYILRNNSNQIRSSNVVLFAKIFRSINQPIESVFEIGSNIGLNLDAINILDNKIRIDCLEINVDAFNIVKSKPHVKNAYNDSILTFEPNKGLVYDLVFTKGVLIHINPQELSKVYEKIHSLSKKFVLFVEYYNPTPVVVNYRGLNDVLFKRDFAGEFLDKFPSAKLIDYGFVYHRDNCFSQDDATWFLIELRKE